MRKINPLPPIEYLRECFDLNKETGILIWKARPRNHFNTDRGWRCFNSRDPGKKAGCVSNDAIAVKINGVMYQVRRVVVALTHGTDPGQMLVNHSDCNYSNNCPKNLRVANNYQCAVNLPVKSRLAKSGFRGVYWYNRYQKWKAVFNEYGRCRTVGYYSTIEEAAAAVKEARLRAYGEFAHREAE